MKDRKLKREIRERMRRTGERYVVARSKVLADEPEATQATTVIPVIKGHHEADTTPDRERSPMGTRA